MLTNFLNSFNVGLRSKFVTRSVLDVQPYIQCVITLLCEKRNQKQQNSNISNIIPIFCFIVDKINQINLIVCVLFSHSKS